MLEKIYLLLGTNSGADAVELLYYNIPLCMYVCMHVCMYNFHCKHKTELQYM